MKKKLIIFSGLFAVLLAVVFLSVLLVPGFVDWNRHREKIAAMVADATGRALRIEGDIRLSIFPDIEFSVEKIHLGNVAGAKEADMASIGAVSGKVRLLPLLGRRFVVDSLVVSDPVLHLEVDGKGRPNWLMGQKDAVPGAPETSSQEKGAGLPFREITLGEVHLSRGGLTFTDGRTGQAIIAKEIDLTAALADMGSPFSLALRMTLNGEKVRFDLSVETFKNLLAGLPANLDAVVDSKFLNTGYRGRVQLAPVPGLAGRFDLDVPSSGKLATWLGRPLDPAMKDPGPIRAHAVFEGEGTKVALTEGVIDAAALAVKATGSYDGSGKRVKMALDVVSETLDIDRYLPSTSVHVPASTGKPGTEGKEKRSRGTVSRVEAKRSGSKGEGTPGGGMAALSGEPIDLSAIRGTDAHVRVAIGGIRAMGVETGRVDFTGTLENGLLSADLKMEKLLGGSVDGRVTLDGAGDELRVSAALTIDGVDAGRFLKAAAGEETPVTGIVRGSLNAAAKGASPKSLVASLVGSVAFDLPDKGGIRVPGHRLTGIKARLELPEKEGAPRLMGNALYNRQPVTLSFSTDPLAKILSEEEFSLVAAVDSSLLNLGYDGKLRQRPLPGLAGALDLHIPSVGKLASWLGRPLEISQSDPGPLKLSARFTGDAEKAALEQATLEGKAFEASAKGSLELGGAVPKVRGEVRIVNANLNAYLPAQQEKRKTEGKKGKSAKAPPRESPAGWSEEPLDLSALRRVDGEFLLVIDALRYRDITVENGRMRAVIGGGKFEAAIERLGVSGGGTTGRAPVDASGSVTGKVAVDATGPAPRFEYQVTLAEIPARPFLTSFAGSDRISGTMAFKAGGTAAGGHQKALVRTLTGDGGFTFLDGAIHGVNIPAALRRAKSLGLDREAGKGVRTDFAELSGSFVIRGGVLENSDLKMLAPLVRLNGAGKVPLPERAVDYGLTATLVASLKGQGGKDSLAGVPIPVNISGPWEDIAFKVDWKKVFGSIMDDPERLKSLPGSLREAGRNFGIRLPVQTLPQLPGAEPKEKGADPLDLLRELVPKKEKTPETPSSRDALEEEKKPEKVDPAQLLKGLFK